MSNVDQRCTADKNNRERRSGADKFLVSYQSSRVADQPTIQREATLRRRGTILARSRGIRDRRLMYVNTCMQAAHTRCYWRTLANYEWCVVSTSNESFRPCKEEGGLRSTKYEQSLNPQYNAQQSGNFLEHKRLQMS